MKNLVINNVRWILLVSGIFTAIMFVGFIAPHVAMEMLFGRAIDGNLETLIMRGWSGYIGLMGAVQIYAFFNANTRVFASYMAVLSKAILVLTLLLFGRDFLTAAAGVLVLDSAVIIILGYYLLTVPKLQKSES